MKLLLDTQVIVWFAGDPEKIPPRALDTIILESEELCVSVVSAWEYGAQRAKFADRLPQPFEALLLPEYRRLGLDFALHGYAERLPAIHRDPFDRMLIAQAIELGLTLVTSDETIRRYPLATLW